MEDFKTSKDMCNALMKILFPDGVHGETESFIKFLFYLGIGSSIRLLRQRIGPESTREEIREAFDSIEREMVIASAEIHPALKETLSFGNN